MGTSSATSQPESSTEPAVSALSAATSIRSLPRMSPSRPMIGVKIDADSRYAVRTQVTLLCDVCSPAWIVGSTGITSDCSSAKPPTATASTAKVTRYRVRLGAVIICHLLCCPSGGSLPPPPAYPGGGSPPPTAPGPQGGILGGTGPR